MKFKASPCFRDGSDCPKRSNHCHETCQEFKDWRAELDADNKAKQNPNDKEYLRYIVPKFMQRRKRKNEKNNT